MSSQSRPFTPHVPSHHGLSRRTLLGLGLGAGVAGISGCSGPTSSGKAADSGVSGGAAVPQEIAPKLLPGEKRSSVANVPAVQTRYPSHPVASVQSPPGSGDTITTLQLSYAPPPPPNGSNQWFQQYQRNLNATMKTTLMTADSIAQKTQAVIAGGDLPDIFYLNVSQVPAAQTAVLQGAFLDLAPFLAGDKVSEYPNLAALQHVSWENSLINGHLYGVPYPTALIKDGLPFWRLDWQQKLGIKDPQNADEMFALFTAIVKNDPDGNGKADTWVWGAMDDWQNRTVLNMFDVPNNWKKNSDGTFTHMIETEEWKAAVSWLIRGREAGFFHPNATSNSYAQSLQLFQNGQTASFGGGLAQLTQAVPVKGVSDWNTQVWTLFPVGAEGGEAHLWQSSASFGLYSIPAKVGSDQAKVHELLSIINYWAAPFGSSEYTFLNFGIEGHTYTVRDGYPVVSQSSTLLAEMADNYVPSPSQQNLFVPQSSQLALKIQKGFERVTPGSIADPSQNLLSKTRVSVGAQLDQILKDIYVDLVSGRQPMSALPSMIDKWKRAGGDQVRADYEKAAK